MKVKDCMCKNVCCIKADTKLNEVAKLMSENHIGCIPICDESDCICGIITDRDVILRCIACDNDAKNVPVSEIMSTNVCTCEENEDITDATGIMSRNHIRRLPVCDSENHVIGILTLGDIANQNKKIGEEEVSDTIENICDSKTNQNAE